MLLNEFLKEHRAVQEQKATIAQLKRDFQSRLAEQQSKLKRYCRLAEGERTA